MKEWDDLKQQIADTETDVVKATNGNRAAGTRVRKAMQAVKKLAQAVRVGLLKPTNDEQSAS